MDDLFVEIKNIMCKEGIEPVEVSSNRNYWFIRTQGGCFYNEFLLDGFIAIGYENVPSIPENNRSQSLIEAIKEQYSQPTRVLNQVYRFCEEIKKDDIVIIPSESSAAFAFGYIVDDNCFTVELTEEEIAENKCDFKRRRKVKWLFDTPKHRVDYKLYTFFRNQQTLSKVTDYADFIERALNTFYIKNGVAHLTISVETEECPDALDIPQYLQGIFLMANQISDQLNLSKDQRKTASRINVQSPGIIELISTPCFLGLIGLVIVGLFGGKVSFKTHDSSIDLSTDGLPGLISEINKTSHSFSNEQLLEIQDKLKIKDPRKKE